MSQHQEAVLQAALGYAARGWRVFPLESIDENGACTCRKVNCEDAGKHPPRGLRWKQEATTDPAQIEKWFGEGTPLANVAIATGLVSGITVLDIDISPTKRGAETWQQLTGGVDPDTFRVLTGSGGFHFFFLHNSVLKNSANTLGPGVDCRNDSGYVVAPPSRHRLKKGAVYKVEHDVAPIALPLALTQRLETRGRPRTDDPTRQKYSIEQVRGMLEFVAPDDRDLWRSIGIILGREFVRVDAAWELYNEWSSKWGGKEGRNHNEIMHEAFYELSQQGVNKELSMGTIVRAAILEGWVPKAGEVPIEQFVFYGPGNNFIYRTTASYWIAEAVNAAVTPKNEDGKITKAADWLRLNKLVTSMTSDPAVEVDYSKGFDCRDGVVIASPGAALFNTYRPPTIEPGDARLATPFLEHVRRVFPKTGDADQFLNYMAHRVQKPAEKPRFALLIAGDQGVGKDTAVEMCCPAMGPWNVANIDPGDLDSTFNEFAAHVLVRVSEAANLHDMNKWAFNERMKVLIAGTPDFVNINPKYGQKFSVRLHCGVVLTTNHMTSGIYIPQDDRRYDVIECATKAEMGIGDEQASREYFSELWDWFYKEDGATHVAALLIDRDILKFSAANGQRKTEAHTAVVSSNMLSDHWVLDAIEELGDPKAVRATAIVSVATKNGAGPERELHARLAQAMLRAGYHVHRNPNRKDGRWQYENKKLSIVYVKNGVKWDEAELIRPSLNIPF